MASKSMTDERLAEQKPVVEKAANSKMLNKYDSVFLVNPDGSSIIILKNYEQQYPLSYHYINNMNKII